MALTSLNTLEKLRNPVKIAAAPFLLFSGFSLAYIFLAPNVFQQDWDSLMYAYWAEINGIRSIWGNHPLGHVLLNPIYVLLTSLGFQGRALPVFIVCNGLAGGMAVALFFSLLRRIGIEFWFSLGYAVVFGASYALWRLSGSADIYSISVLVLISAWMSLLYELQTRNARSLALSGAIAGLSVLAHQLNAVFFVAAVVIIYFHKGERWQRAVTFLGAAFVVLFSGGLLLGFIATSSSSLPEIVGWFQGYLGDDIYGEPVSLDSMALASRVALQSVLVETLGRARFVRAAGYLFLLALMLLGITQVKRLERGKQIVLLAAFLQCLVSFFLITWFEAWYPKFWLLVLVPAMIVIACCIDALAQGYARRWMGFQGGNKYYSPLLVLPGILVLVFNLRYAILSEHVPDEASQESVNTWLQHSDRDDMLITAGDLIPQLWFWSDRPNTVHLYHYLVVNRDSGDRFAYLRDQIDQFLCEGNSVLYTPAIVDHFGSSFLGWLDLPREELKMFFDGYEKESYFTYINRINGQETQVYQLVNPDACAK